MRVLTHGLYEMIVWNEFVSVGVASNAVKDTGGGLEKGKVLPNYSWGGRSDISLPVFCNTQVLYRSSCNVFFPSTQNLSMCY